MKAYLSLIVLFVSISCGPKEKAEETSKHYASLPESLMEVMQSHGGLERWKTFRSLEYDLRHEKDSLPTEHYVLDLLNRKDLTVADSFKIGFNGNDVWVSPNKKAYKGRSARFYHNLYSYFLTIPFIVADPGINYTADTLSVNGKLYNVINISFNEGVGDADKDTYKMLIDPNTKRMEKLLYTVTYYTGESHDNYNALSYEEFKEINGVILPTKLVGYKYSNGMTGDKRYEVEFSNIRLTEESPMQELFDMPKEAEVDSLKL